MKQGKTVLCVDDNEDNVELLKIYLEQDGYTVTSCGTAEECIEHIGNKEFAAIVLDYKLSDKDGLEVCREIKQTKPHIPILFFSGDVRNATRNIALAAGADAYLIKPDDLENVAPTIGRLIESNSEINFLA